MANTQMERCPVCDWPMAKSVSEGCVPGNCSYRPHQGTAEYYRIQQRRAHLSRSTPAAPETPPDSRLERIAKIIWERHYARFYVPWNEVGQGEQSSAYRGVPVDMSADDNVSAQAYVLETANEILAETPRKEEA